MEEISSSKDIKVYTEEEHFKNASEFGVHLYNKFKNAILKLNGDIQIKPKKCAIGFMKSERIFTDICIFKKYIAIYINLKKGSLNDPKEISKDVSAKGHWGNGDYKIEARNDTDLKYILRLINQAL